MPISNVERYKARKTPYYVHTSSRGQVTLPKPLRDVCGFDAKNQLVKVTALETGLFLEPVIAVIVKNQNKAGLEEYEKEFYRDLARRR